MTGSGIATVARQEFRLRIRAGKWKWLVGAFFLVLLAFTALLRASVSSLTDEEREFAGAIVYGGLMLFVLGLALLVVPALAAQSVNGDRERGTLATLQVTRLSAGEITLGKFAAAWGTALVFLALTFPLVAYAMTQGGVPFGRVVVVTLVLAVLLGTVCAVSLWLSSVLSRTTTSAVLAYLTVFGLTLGTLIMFGLATAVTTEDYQEQNYACPYFSNEEEALSGDGEWIDPCQPDGTTYTAQRARTDRTWFLLAPNPFVVLADAAPRLPEPKPTGNPEDYAFTARDLDPLGQLGGVVRDLRLTPTEQGNAFEGGYSPGLESVPGDEAPVPESRPVWPTGLAVNVVLAVGALLLTSRRLRTPSRKLPKGQRVA